MTDRWLRILNRGDDRVICQGPGRHFSMAQLRKRINSLQSKLIEKEYYKWVLYDDDGFEFVCAMFALLALGKDVLVPTSQHKEVIKTLLDKNTGMIGFNSELKGLLDIEVSRDKPIDDPGLDNAITSPGKWGRIKFCTSGSSGEPKLITKSAEQLLHEVEIFRDIWRPSQNTLFVPLVMHSHIYGLTFAYLLPLLAQAGIYLPRISGMLGIVEPITPNSRSEIDGLVIVTSPTIGRRIEKIKVLAEPGSLVSNDRPAPISRVFCAGGKLTDVNAKQIIELFDSPITEIFGSTETGAVATRSHSILNTHNITKSWELLPGLEAMAIGNGINNESACGSKGEFAVWGGHVGGSKSEPVRSGDEVIFVSHHQFELLGRSNRTCKIEGKRISLDHIVELLESCDLVKEAVSLPFEQSGKEILLCGVVLSNKGLLNYQNSGKPATDQIIRELLLRFLDPILVPRSIRYLDELPRNEMGKIPHGSLLEMLANPVFPDFPTVMNSKLKLDELMLSLRIPMELSFLRGHFINRPIVPGVILLNWVYYFAYKYWKCILNPATVSQLKFSRPVIPGERLTLMLWLTGKSVKFVYQDEQQTKYASGQIPLSPDLTDV